MDDTTLDIILEALDTITDFTAYLAKKEALFDSSVSVAAAGEEELLAHYLTRINQNQEHDFNFPSHITSVMLPEGIWEGFRRHPDQLAKRKADEISYVWDALIEKFAHHTLGGTLVNGSSSTISEIESGLRFMARANRTERRMLARSLLAVLKRGNNVVRAARVLGSPQEGAPGFVFLSLSPPDHLSREEYLAARRNLLHAYCLAAKLKFPNTRFFVGIAAEPTAAAGDHSEDLAFLDTEGWNEESDKEARRVKEELDLLNEVNSGAATEFEYPSENHRNLGKGRSRNVPCPCGSSKKAKNCCGRKAV